MTVLQTVLFLQNCFTMYQAMSVTSGTSQGSDEERRDVVEAYKKHKGKMTAVTNSIMLASPADEDRFRAVIDAAIQAQEVTAFAAFKKGSKTNAASKKAAAKRKAKIDKVNTSRKA